VCAAGRLDGACWLIGPGSAGLAQGCPCALPLQAWAGHIVAAARLQLVKTVIALSCRTAVKWESSRTAVASKSNRILVANVGNDCTNDDAAMY